MIGMVCAELARFSETYASLMALEMPPGTRFIQNYHISFAHGQNEIGRYFLESDCDFLFLTNDDQIYPSDTLSRLLSHDKDIVSGLYLRRSFPFEPIIFSEENEQGIARTHYLKDGETGLIPVVACGSGAVLIRRKVLETLPAPWWKVGTVAPDLISEDLTFCHDARRAGFEVWCDLDVRVGHITVTPIFPQIQDGKWITLLRHGEGFGSALPAAEPINV